MRLLYTEPIDELPRTLHQLADAQADKLGVWLIRRKMRRQPHILRTANRGKAPVSLHSRLAGPVQILQILKSCDRGWHWVARTQRLQPVLSEWRLGCGGSGGCGGRGGRSGS